MKFRLLLIFLSFLLLSWVEDTGSYSTRKGQVSFRSDAPEELIEAYNSNVAAQVIPAEGKGMFIIPIKSFRFKKALLQEHFNENYMESDTYPKASYTFTISDIQNVDFGKAGRYPVNTNGVLTIKKTSGNISVPGFIVVTDNRTIRIESDFSLSPADYDIRIPTLVANKIAKDITIKVNCTLNKH